MPRMLFYDRIVPLNRERHRNLRLRTTDGRATFAADIHYAPLAGSELYGAARDYPVIFTGGEGAPGLVALLGLQERQNLFVDADGRWARGTYVPAFVRRYPFVLAESEGKDELTVCIDDQYAGFNETEGEALFNEAGEESTYLRGIIQFLERFRAEMTRTAEFAARLANLGLLAKKDLQITDGEGRRYRLQDFRIVDEAKLAELDDETLGELHRAGHLGWIYAHLISLGSATRLPARLAGRDAGAEAATVETPDAQ